MKTNMTTTTAAAIEQREVARRSADVTGPDIDDLELPIRKTIRLGEAIVIASRAVNVRVDPRRKAAVRCVAEQ
jgi:hypothetical protein